MQSNAYSRSVSCIRTDVNQRKRIMTLDGTTYPARFRVDVNDEFAVQQRFAQRTAPNLIRAVANWRPIREPQALNLPVVLFSINLCGAKRLISKRALCSYGRGQDDIRGRRPAGS